MKAATRYWNSEGKLGNPETVLPFGSLSFHCTNLTKIHVHGLLFHRPVFTPDAVVCQLLICLEAGGYEFHDIADSVLSHSNFAVPDICWLRTIYDAQIEGPRILLFLWSLRQPELEEPHWISFSAVGAIHNLWCSSSPDWQTTASCFGWTFAELYDFSAIFLLSYHEVFYARLYIRVVVCSWRPRKPSCSVKFFKFLLVSTFPLKSPIWLFSHRADSSSGGSGCALMTLNFTLRDFQRFWLVIFSILFLLLRRRTLLGSCLVLLAALFRCRSFQDGGTLASCGTRSSTVL